VRRSDRTPSKRTGAPDRCRLDVGRRPENPPDPPDGRPGLSADPPERTGCTPDDQKTLKIRQRAGKAYPPIRQKALAARRRGAEEEAQAILKGVAAWGLDDFADDLRASLAAAPLPEKPLSPEVRAWQAAWENGLAL